MFGLKRHLPPLVVVAMTDGAFVGYSINLLSQPSQLDEVFYNVPLPNFTEN